MDKKFYAVKVGLTPGIYTSWDECKAQVHGVIGAKYKSFKTINEAELFISSNQDNNKIEQLSMFNNQAPNEAQDFLYSDQDTGVAYVDGSYNNVTKQFSYGVVMFHNGKEIHLSKMVEDEELALMRNVAGEIMGARAAMQFALDNHCKNLTIVHDYEGISKWCLGLWKTNKDGTKAYKKFYDEAKTKINIKFVKVKGHSNDKYNDLADELAKKAIFNC